MERARRSAIRQSIKFPPSYTLTTCKMMPFFLIHSGYSYYNKNIKEPSSNKDDDAPPSSLSPSPSTRVPPPTTSTLKEYIVNYILCPSLAGIIMHGPGLYVKFHYEDTSIQSLVGAAFEGVFLLLLATRALHAGKSAHDYLQQQTNYSSPSSSSSSSSNKLFIVQKLCRMWSTSRSILLWIYILNDTNGCPISYNVRE